MYCTKSHVLFITQNFSLLLWPVSNNWIILTQIFFSVLTLGLIFKVVWFLFLFSSFCFWRKKALVLIHWVFCSLPLGSGGMSLHWVIKWRLNGYGLKVKAIGHIFTFSTKYLLSVCLYIRFLKQVNLSVISSSILYSHIMKWS